MSLFRVSRDRVSLFDKGVMIYPSTAAPKLNPEPEQPDEAAEVQFGDEAGAGMSEDPILVALSAGNELAEEFEKIKERENELDELQHEYEEKYQALLESAQAKIENAKIEADKIRADAREHANLLEAEAEAKLEKMRGDAREEGFALGMKQAEEEAEKRRQLEALELAGLVGELREERERISEALKPDVIGLVMEIVKRVIRTELDENDRTFIELVEYEISKLKHSEYIAVSVSADDFAKYFLHNPEAQAELCGEDGKITVQENRELHSGDCIIESDTEIVDCGIAGQLERVEEILLREAGISNENT